MNDTRGSPEQIKADVEFHMGILDASRNPMLRSVGAMIQSALSITFTLSWRTAMRDDAVIQHRDVYDAIRDRKPEEAFMAMRRLLRASKGDVFDAIWASRQNGEDIR
jgi:DNA-binding FadR family transcriptional regulator